VYKQFTNVAAGRVTEPGGTHAARWTQTGET